MSTMTIQPIRYVGHSDFHDGSVVTVSRTGNKMHVTIKGSSGKHYVIGFSGVSSVESESPEGMMLYALAEAGTETASLLRYEFVNWHADEADEPRSKSHLRIVANSFTVADAE